MSYAFVSTDTKPSLPPRSGDSTPDVGAVQSAGDRPRFLAEIRDRSDVRFEVLFADLRHASGTDALSVFPTVRCASLAAASVRNGNVRVRREADLSQFGTQGLFPGN